MYCIIQSISVLSKLSKNNCSDLTNIRLRKFSISSCCSSKHSTDFYIFSVKTVSQYYTQQHSPAFTCFLDASKAIDKINHIKLFRKLLYRETPIVIVRILLFWYSKQTVCMKWGQARVQGGGPKGPGPPP